MRTHPTLLGERILQEYPVLHRFGDPPSTRIAGLLRNRFPAQTIAIIGIAKRWQHARTGMLIAECGTGKTLISLGAIHVHSEGKPSTSLAMAPPHLVEKWAREAFLTFPGLRVFLIDDLRNRGDDNKSHGVNEVRLRQGRIVREGPHTTLSELRLSVDSLDLANQAYVPYRNNSDGRFAYASVDSGLAKITKPHSRCGVRFLDFDNSGWKDLLIAQRHALDTVELNYA